jgi:signal transduction histidine kinase
VAKACLPDAPRIVGRGGGEPPGMLNDPLSQVIVVGTIANASGAAIALYLWNQQRSERYLLFWAGAWIVGATRFLIHLPADASPLLRVLEIGLLFPLLFIFNVLGSYDLLPTKPWRSKYVVTVTAAVLFGYGFAALGTSLPFGMAYALVTLVFLLDGICLWTAYRATHLSGHAIGAVTFFCWSAWFSIGLVILGNELPKSIVGPLFNIPLALSLVMIALQRRARELAESQHTLQKIFDTAPTAIVITRPPGNEVERANAHAFELFDVASAPLAGSGPAFESAVGTAALRAELEAGRRVSGHELAVSHAGKTRTFGVNADRLDLATGRRHIFSFYDLTELRRAESEMRGLYVRLANAEDAERRALHRELHDTVGANLSALWLELDVVAALLARDAREAALQHLRSAREVTTETLTMARDLMAGLRPPALDDFGLVAALRAYAESQSARLGIDIEVVGEDLAPRPGSLVEAALFRIALEAVINAARHAAPHLVTVTVGERAGRVLLRVEDDGIGFDPATQGSRPGHWGLQNMRERARAIGAMLEIVTAPQAGTTVLVEAPREAA